MNPYCASHEKNGETHSKCLTRGVKEQGKETPLSLLYQQYTGDASLYIAHALHTVTGWLIVSIADQRGRIHDCVTHDGQFLDIYGWSSLRDIERRYAANSLSIHAAPKQRFNLPDQEITCAINVLERLPYRPFNEPWFRTRLEVLRAKTPIDHGELLEHDDDMGIDR